MKIEPTKEVMKGQKMNLSHLTWSIMVWKKDYEMECSVHKLDGVANFNKDRKARQMDLSKKKCGQEIKLD